VLVAADRPTGAGFDVLLIAHVASVMVGFGAILASGVQAGRGLRVKDGVPVPVALVRYYRPGPALAGRVVYLVPLLGVGLLADSRGVFGVEDLWVVLGIMCWVVAVGVAEGVLWPAERQIKRRFLARAELVMTPALRRQCRSVCLSSGLVVAIALVAIVMMVWQP